jgi:hypothetical protein
MNPNGDSTYLRNADLPRGIRKDPTAAHKIATTATKNHIFLAYWPGPLQNAADP